LVAEGVDVEAWQVIENDSLEYTPDDEVVDLGYIDPQDGTFKRPWCAATRILEHRENEKIERYCSCKPFMLQGSLAHESLVNSKHVQTCREQVNSKHEQPCREQEVMRSGQQQGFGRENKQRPRMTELPSVTEDTKLMQRNEGDWDFTLDVSEDGSSIELEVAIPRHLDTALVQVPLTLLNVGAVIIVIMCRSLLCSEEA
jgi:protein TilB